MFNSFKLLVTRKNEKSQNRKKQKLIVYFIVLKIKKVTTKKVKILESKFLQNWKYIKVFE